MATIQELRTLALQIRDADEDRENTALKVGQFLYDLLGYLDTKADLTMKGQWSKQLNFNQAPIVALQSVEAIPDSQGQNNKMWWSSDDGQLKWKANDEVYPLGSPTYILYYCGNKIYRWSGSSTGFTEMRDDLVNNLFTPSAEKAPSAGVIVVIRNNVDILQAKLDALIDALAPLAYTGGGVAKAGLLDWSGNGVFFVTVGYNLTGVTATDNTDADSHIVVGGNLVVTLTTLQYYTLTGATFEVKDDKNNTVQFNRSGNTITITNLTRSVTIKVVGVLSGAHLVTLPSVEHLTFKDENDNEVSGSLIVPDNDPLELTLVQDALWGIESCAVTMSGNDVANAYSWVFDANYNRVHTISIEHVTGGVGIAVVMEDWNVQYNNVNAKNSGRFMWGYYPSHVTPLIPIVAGHSLQVTFGYANNDSNSEHFITYYGSSGRITTILSSDANDSDGVIEPTAYGTKVRISFHPDKKSGVKLVDLTAGQTLWDGSQHTSDPTQAPVKFIERFAANLILADGFKNTAIAEPRNNSDGKTAGIALYPYVTGVWGENYFETGAACSFQFKLPGVSTLKVYCGAGGGTLYTFNSNGGGRKKHPVPANTEQTFTNIETAYTAAKLLCANGATDLSNSYVKYGDKYVWWGKGVTVAQADIWEGTQVSSIPDFVEDVWTQNNE